ncbi:MAG: hypothetical protein LW628_05505 [Fimbriimonadaceae bacterium]|nr:hypothetical protein [Fimbriimonadaceae bacterium]
MNRKFSGLMILGVLSGSAFGADATFEKNYRTLDRLIYQLDLVGIQQFWQVGGRTYTAEAFVSAMISQLKTVRKVDGSKSQIMKQSVSGNRVVLEVLSVQSMRMPHINNPKKISNWRFRSTTQDTWLKVGNDYRLVEIKSRKEEAWMDGKAIKL